MNNQENIEKYLNGGMNTEQEEQFLAQVSHDEDLKEELNVYRFIHKNTGDTTLLDIKDSLKRISKKRSLNKKRFLLSSNYWIAASVAVVISLSVFVKQQMYSPVSVQEVFLEYYTAYDLNESYRNVGQVANKGLVKALEYYENEEYEKAKIEFEQISKQEPQNYAIRFYLGITYIETGSAKKAINIFDEIAKDKGNLFLEQAEWYLGICYLKTNMKNKAIVAILSQKEANTS